MSTDRVGDWCQTVSGVQFWPLDPRPDEVRLGDIAHALSHACRFAGHTRQFYSVAQHSVLVAQHVRPELRSIALLHDATEAYICDLPRPIKRSLPAYKAMEQRLALAIGARFGLPLDPLPDNVKLHDMRALYTERRDLLGAAPATWTDAQGAATEPWAEWIDPWDPPTAKRRFLAFAHDLGIVDESQGVYCTCGLNLAGAHVRMMRLHLDTCPQSTGRTAP